MTKFQQFNWKAGIALVVLVGAIFWGIDSLRMREYSGTDLNFGVGSGPVVVTNPSDQSIPVQFVGGGSASFTISSTIEAASGRSIREGTGQSATQSLPFELPPGSSEFTLERGTNVSFVADSETRLAATVQPASDGQARTTVIIVVVVVLASLFYISRSTDHRWIKSLRGQETAVPDLKLGVETASGGQGQNLQSYGDNRARTGD